MIVCATILSHRYESVHLDPLGLDVALFAFFVHCICCRVSSVGCCLESPIFRFQRLRLVNPPTSLAFCDRLCNENCQIIDAAIPEDGRVREKEDEKIEKYQVLAREVRRMWGVRSKVIPVVVEHWDQYH